jgi:hypothetical protein
MINMEMTNFSNDLKIHYNFSVYNFFQTLDKKDKGKFGVFLIHHMYDGLVPMPDYSNCYGLFISQEEAEKNKIEYEKKVFPFKAMIVKI